MTWTFRVLPVFALGCAASRPAENAPPMAAPLAPAPSRAAAEAPSQPPLDDGAGEASDRARLHPTACRDRLLGLFRRHNEGADVAATLLEAAHGGYRSEVEGGAPCIDERLKKAIFPYADRHKPSPSDYFYGLYVVLSHNPGFEHAKASGFLGCSDFRYEARGWRPAAAEPLEGGCAIPHAWTTRGLHKAELCLDIQVFALVLSMWTVIGGDPVTEDAFVNLVRYLSAQAPDHPSSRDAPAHCEST